MPPESNRGRAVRWGVPVAAAAVVAAAAGAGPVIAAVQGDPSLPERTAEQLLADAIEAGKSGKVPPLSGTVVETASLGLPGLPDVGGESSSPSSLLAGVNQLKVWYGGEGKVRLALPGRMSETDLIQNGDQTWLWESSTNTATRIKTPQGASGDGLGGHALSGKDAPEGIPTVTPTAITPQEAAREVLARADESTTVSVTNTEQVAGRAAYQLVVAPKDEASLVKEVRLALDGETLVPLRVQVFADGAAEPAFEVGFSSVTFTPPAPEMFAFTPPAGAKVTEKTLGSRGDGAAVPDRALSNRAEKTADRVREGAERIGTGWTTIVSAPLTQKDLLKSTSSGKRWGRYQAEGAGDVRALTKSVLQSAKPVSGAWGNGKLIETKLASILFTDDGRVLAGAVTPEALIEAAGRE